MAPSAQRIAGPSAVRKLLNASLDYQVVVKDVMGDIMHIQSNGHLGDAAQAYANFLIALWSVERDLDMLATFAHPLLGEE